MNTFRVVNGGTALFRAHSTDAGYDVSTRIDARIKPGETMYIPSGVCFDLDDGYCVNVMPRSSSFKYGVIVTPTLIDQGYTGEISTVVTNISHSEVFIPANSRLAQARLERVFYFDNDSVKNSDVRGDGRFGSTGE